ncbi:unnamed protein product [Linum tenue]|uniref:BZIP domain-containing protein n=2 Tax=Linum tenue TaxID=586396 RepID=A0AAV0QK87_9ROSI|nr:unnamed protein product [Linum tenue]
MLPAGEIAGIHFLPQEIPCFPLPHQSSPLSSAAINRILSSNFQSNHHHHDYFVPPPPCPYPNYNSSNGTSDEADEQQSRIVDERKQRRMISNRESARRSRMRKQKHLDELWSQVLRLRAENHALLDKLNHVSDCHDRVVEENARLKDQVSGLRHMLTDLPIGSPYHDNNNTAIAHRAESSSSDQSIPTSSVDLLL